MAVLMLILTPVWAYRWTQIPFLGVSLEQNNVVSQIQGSNWANLTQGASVIEAMNAMRFDAMASRIAWSCATGARMGALPAATRSRLPGRLAILGC